jgi:hypothetical protein
MTFHVIYDRGFDFRLLFGALYMFLLRFFVRNATDQSGLIPAEGMAFVIKKPSNHSYKYLIATIRPTTWVVGAVI